MVNVTYIKFNNLQNTWHSYTNTSDVMPGIVATNIYNNNNNNDSNKLFNSNSSYFNNYHQNHHHLNHNLTSSDVILLIEDQNKNGNRLLNGSSFAIGVLVCAFLTLLIGCCCMCNWYNQYPNTTTNISGTKKRQRQRQQRLINANNNNDININNNSNSRNNDITLFSRNNALRAAIISATTTRNSRNNNNNNDVAMETAATIINNNINSNNNNNNSRCGSSSSDDNISSSNYDHTTSTFFNTTFREYFRDIGTTTRNDRRRRERRNRNSCNQNDRSNRRNVNNNNNGGFLNFTDDDDDENDDVNDRNNYGRQEHSGDPTRDIVRHFEFDVESLPSYTIVSGLPTYDDALEQIRKPGLLITTPNISKLFDNYKQQQEQLNLNQSVDNIQTKLSGQDVDSQDTSITIEGSTGNSTFTSIQNSQQLPPTIVITNPNESGATNSSTNHTNEMNGNNLTQIIELGPDQLNLLSQKRLSVQIAFSAPSISRSQLNLTNSKLNVPNNDYPLLHGRTPSLSVRHLHNRRGSDFLRNSIYIKNVKRNAQHRGSLG